MTNTPTMQELATHAWDKLRESDQREEDLAVILDTVVEVYARENRRVVGAGARLRAREAVAEVLSGEQQEGRKEAIAAFADKTLQFLAFQYSQPAQVLEERWLCTHLFRHYLEEAKLRTATSGHGIPIEA